MTQKSFHWNGSSLGDANLLTENAPDGIGYRLSNEDYESPFVDIGLRMILNGDEDRGVLLGWLNELEVTGVATPVSINTGGAIIYGMPYENTAAVTVAVPSPTTDTRQDRIVLRRSWAAQTVRITRIAGVEGGGIPAMTQSPAPDGTGIYDIPLATLSTTTGGVITVTDAREFCLFGTALADDSIGATQIIDASIDWEDRTTRTKRLFLGGGDLQPVINAGKWTTPNGSTRTWTGAPTWDGGADEEGWQLTGSIYEGVIGAFRPPADYASPGAVSTYVWWVDNAGVASTFYMNMAIQGYLLYPGYFTYSGIDSAGTEVDETLVASNVYRTAGPSTSTYGSSFGYGQDYLLWYFVAYWYNSAVGAEDVSILGVEIEYEAYV